MNRPISKRAGVLETVKDVVVQFAETIYREDQGPFQNGFRILAYGFVPFLGSLGRIITFILGRIALGILGLPPGFIGKMIDETIGLKPGDDPRQPGIKEKAEKAINDIFEPKLAAATASDDPYPISKTAGIMSILKTGGLIGKYLIKGLYWLFGAAASVFVFSHAEKVIEEQITGPAREQIGEWGYPEKVVETVTGKTPEEVSELLGKTPRRRERPRQQSADELADYIERKYGLN
jgi:hypothetical protein